MPLIVVGHLSRHVGGEYMDKNNMLYSKYVDKPSGIKTINGIANNPLIQSKL